MRPKETTSYPGLNKDIRCFKSYVVLNRSYFLGAHRKAAEIAIFHRPFFGLDGFGLIFNF